MLQASGMSSVHLNVTNYAKSEVESWAIYERSRDNMQNMVYVYVHTRTMLSSGQLSSMICICT